jgi:mRNA interferase YafQ
MGIVKSTAFKKDVDVCVARGYDLTKLKVLIEKLSNKEKLEQKHKDHKIAGKFDGHRECHVEPDWLLIYRLDSGTLYLIRTGTHADLFE